MSQEQPQSEPGIVEGEREDRVQKDEPKSEKKEEDKCESKEEAKDGQPPPQEHAESTEQETEAALAKLVELGKVLMEAGELKEAIDDIAKSWNELQEEIRKAGGLSEIEVLAEVLAEGHIFHSIDPETGRIHDSVDGNVLFGMDGTDNSLGETGKVILDNIASGKFKRNVKPFACTIPGGSLSFRLDFYKERDRCLRKKVLFRDPQFKACHSSLFHKDANDKEIEWLRPGEIVSKPRFVVKGHSRFDVNQGHLGDCYFLAAAASLTLRDELFYRVIPPDQSFTENYAGIFHFQFWRYGEWVDVVIDDRLPTKDGQLVYSSSRQTTEFWSALLEKAYAKLYGSYEAIEGGLSCEALEDFTGGLAEIYVHKDIPKKKLLSMIMNGLQMGSMFVCALSGKAKEGEEKCPHGLVRDHAYSVTGLQTVKVPSGETVLIRVRNPWGDESEWNGAWSDKAPEWKDVSDEQKAIMKVAHDGEFWMSFDDFIREFNELEVCHLGAEVVNEISEMIGSKDAQQKTWYSSSADGFWYRSECGIVDEGDDSGALLKAVDEDTSASPLLKHLFALLIARLQSMDAKFDQVLAKLDDKSDKAVQFEKTEIDADYPLYEIQMKDDSAEKDGSCTFIVALMQKYRREQRKDGMDNTVIAFSVYQWDPEDGEYTVDMDLLRKKKPLAEAENQIREITGSFRGPPGRYVIEVRSSNNPLEGEPKKSIYKKDIQAEYHLRVFATVPIELTELN